MLIRRSDFMFKRVFRINKWKILVETNCFGEDSWLEVYKTKQNKNRSAVIMIHLLFFNLKLQSDDLDKFCAHITYQRKKKEETLNKCLFLYKANVFSSKLDKPLEAIQQFERNLKF